MMGGELLAIAAGFGLVNIGMLTKIYFMLGGHIEKVDNMDKRLQKLEKAVI